MTEDFFQEVRQYLAVLHKRRSLTILGPILGLLIALLYTFTARPLYRATCQILIEHDIPNVLPTREVMELQGGADYYQTQYQLLRGRNLAEAVVQKLNLQHSSEFQTGPLMSPWERLRRKVLGSAPPPPLGSD